MPGLFPIMHMIKMAGPPTCPLAHERAVKNKIAHYKCVCRGNKREASSWVVNELSGLWRAAQFTAMQQSKVRERLTMLGIYHASGTAPALTKNLQHEMTTTLFFLIKEIYSSLSLSLVLILTFEGNWITCDGGTVARCPAEMFYRRGIECVWHREPCTMAVKITAKCTDWQTNGHTNRTEKLTERVQNTSAGCKTEELDPSKVKVWIVLDDRKCWQGQIERVNNSVLLFRENILNLSPWKVET